ncbi:hypothetical protein CBR_g45423 [Chara braunii]|uniref:Uncharacterized protein n=1 Tax=Chara braunii TaxID=69332 RepID=A0A388LYM6_CHABU|nr:hypothetical protein CBR_g45423 [Chara braunii]|eukprot:GBG87363.1 hypothetical protein CBR_g45423 [Chara braunii]
MTTNADVENAVYMPRGEESSRSEEENHGRQPRLQSVETTLLVANPGPLGLNSFAITTFILSMFNAGILPASVEKVVIPLAYFYGGSVQVLAGIAELVAKNTFGATAFCSYGAFWLSFAYYVMAIAPGLDKEKVHIATGLFLFTWTVFTTYMAVASSRTFRALNCAFVLLAITFALLTIGEWGEVKGFKKAGGYFGLLTAITAWYCAFGLVLLDTWKYEVVPLAFYKHKINVDEDSIDVDEDSVDDHEDSVEILLVMTQLMLMKTLDVDEDSIDVDEDSVTVDEDAVDVDEDSVDDHEDSVDDHEDSVNEDRLS